MRAQLKEMYSLQISEMLKDFKPEALDNFGISVRLMIGPEGTDQSESFDLLICTPAWLHDQVREEGCVWGRHMLIVQQYDHEALLRSISSRISSCIGKSWEEVANMVARYAAWEFEDYQPSN